MFDDDLCRHPGRFIRFFAVSDTVDQVDELERARLQSENVIVVGIPFVEDPVSLDVVTVLNTENRPEGHLIVPASWSALIVLDFDFPVAGDHHGTTVAARGNSEALEQHFALALCRNLRLLGDAARCPTNVEGPQRKLGTGSPTLWAAITPTASPVSTIRPVAGFRP